MPTGWRAAPPAKMTSSPRLPRSARTRCSPSAQRSASAMLLLPEPFGPTIAVMPRSKRRRVRRGKLLKPVSSSCLRYKRSAFGRRERGIPGRERGLGRGPLGGLLAAAAAARRFLAVDQHRDGKRRAVLWAGGLQHAVQRRDAVLELAALLEARFLIQQRSV